MLHAVAPKIPNVFITEELDRRTPVKIDALREKKALQEIAALMADEPAQVLPKFVSLAMEMTKGPRVHPNPLAWVKYDPGEPGRGG